MYELSPKDNCIIVICNMLQVLLVDADLLPLHSLDSLFELRVPAATFSSPWANSCKEDGYVDPYVVGVVFLSALAILIKLPSQLLLLMETLWKRILQSVGFAHLILWCIKWDMESSIFHD